MTDSAKCSSCSHDVHAGACPELEYVGHGYSPCTCGVCALTEPAPSWEVRLEGKVDHLADAVLALHEDVRRLVALCEQHEQRIAAVESGRRLTLTPLPDAAIGG